jgi:hypothetical protein
MAVWRDVIDEYEYYDHLKTKNMANAKSLIWYALALIGNVVGWVAIGHNANERYPFWVFVTCILSMTLAGYLTVYKAKEGGDWIKWIVWSALVGIVEATALVFMV